ncbi:hypothetical protein O181_005466 [Austropuccinia psidii MF-1]|uniref:Uncharacterized protein n=1 Tax=Austropuccinia psidii MF-1 TaxID=1389203 RepID=A0A9Q3BHA7_9BASI|nr:hypothetical protein [Austropuccinia psidii MF-1]
MLQRWLPSLRLQCAPNMPLMPLTILTLAVTSRHASDAAYHSYARIVPSQHASDATYHAYTRIVPTRHASNAAYHPYAWSALLTCLRRPLTLA